MMNNEEWKIINQSNNDYINQQENKKRMVKKLLDYVSKNDKEKIKTLKPYISFSEVYDNKVTALSIATLNNDLDMVSFLINNGASVNTIFDDGIDVIWLALSKGNHNLLKYFLKNGGIVNFKYGEHTRLIQAVEASDVEAVKTLLNYGVNVNEKDNQGRTALHYNFFKNPYTENDKQIGILLTVVGLNPLEEDINEIPAYGYLDDIQDIKDFYDISKCQELPSYKLKRIEKMKEKDMIKDGILAKYKDVQSITKTVVKKPKSFKSYYMPKIDNGRKPNFSNKRK